MKATMQKETTEKPIRAEPQEYVVPAVNILEEKDGYRLEAEMPGVSKDGLELLLEGNELTIVGHRQRAAVGGHLIFRESHTADYSRVFELDPAIDSSRIAAKMNQGVLTLTLPKSEKVKPRKIVVSD
jgi:HSP20 family protein